MLEPAFTLSDPPDWAPRPWTAEERRARTVPAKITDPEERKAALKRATTGLRTTVRIEEIADTLSRGWPEPLDH
ncbi:MAG TPA: hypothetical protein VE972_15345 [Conexibacter sp.]|nr:hypothetical protein [Conexibacter sp.]